MTNRLLKLAKIVKASPSEIAFQLSPDTLNGVDLRAIGWLKNQDDVVRDRQTASLVRGGIIFLNQMQIIGKLSRNCQDERTLPSTTHRSELVSKVNLKPPPALT